MQGPFKYRAFISYNHRDGKWAQWLHRGLESYRIPKQLIGTDGRDGPVPARLFPIYRDRDEAASSSDLSLEIRIALEQSAYLIVICSPNSASSRLVNEEILAFKRMGRENRILALVVDGEPSAGDGAGGDAARECFPSALKFRIAPDGALTGDRVEPLAADARSAGDGKNNAKLKLLSGLLGIDYDALRRRDEQAARRRARVYQSVAAAMALLALLAIVAAWFGLEKQHEAEQQRDQTIEAQSRSLTQTAAASLKDSDVRRAMNIILEVLSRSKNKPLDPTALSVFQEARVSDHQLVVLSGHSEYLWFAAWSPDGNRIVTASEDHTARIWDASTGRPIVTLRGHTGPVHSAAFAPDGRRIVTASADHTARVWNVATGRQEMVLAGHTDRVEFAAFSPEGRRIVTASGDRTVRIWDAATGRPLKVFTGHTDRVESAQFSSDGSRIVTASDDKTARVWDVLTGQQLVVLKGHTDLVGTGEFSADGRRVVTASDDKTARVWDVATGRQILLLSGHANAVTSAAFSPDAGRIVTASLDHTARIWDAVTGQQIMLLSGHQGWVMSGAFSPDGRRIVSASFDKTARTWGAETEHQISLLGGHTDIVNSAAFAPDGRHIITASSDNTARIWDASTGRQTMLLSGHTDAVGAGAFSPDGRLVLTASYDRTARLWDAATGAQIGTMSGHTDVLQYAAFAPDGKHVVTGSADKTARIWDVATNRQTMVLSGHTDVLEFLEYSPDGTRIVTASADKTARIWDAVTGRQIVLLSGHTGKVESSAFSPDGKHVVTASDDQTARIWDAVTGRQIVLLSGHTDGVNSAEYSPDGKRIVTASDDKTVRIWDAETGQQIWLLDGHTDAIEAAAYSPDGTRVLTASVDKSARIWDARVPSFNAQLKWAELAQFDSLSSTERFQLGLPSFAEMHKWADGASICDRSAAAPYDPDRLAPGVTLEEIVFDIALRACSRELASEEDRPRALYQHGRVLLANGDTNAARRDLEQALAGGYRVAAIDLGNSFARPRYKMLAPARAVRLYEQAANAGVAIGNFELGELYEHGAGKFAPDPVLAWFWYKKGAELGDPNALARFGEKCDDVALLAKTQSAKDARFLDAFRYYAVAAERARQEDWPDDAWRNWRYRRATIARLLARDGMMQQIADTYSEVKKKYAPKPPSLLFQIRLWLHKL